MFDINYNNIKKGRLVWYIFIAVAVIFLLTIGIISFTTLSLQKKYTGEATSYKYEFSYDYDSEGDKM